MSHAHEERYFDTNPTEIFDMIYNNSYLVIPTMFTYGIIYMTQRYNNNALGGNIMVEIKKIKLERLKYLQYNIDIVETHESFTTGDWEIIDIDPIKSKEFVEKVKLYRALKKEINAFLKIT